MSAERGERPDFPSDLAAWRAEQVRRGGLKAQVRAQWERLPWHGRPPIRLTASGTAGCDVLIALDEAAPEAMLVLLRPLEHLGRLRVHIASARSLADAVPGGHWREGHADLDAVTALAMRAQVVLAAGQARPLGAAASRGVRASRPERRAQFFTVQDEAPTRDSPPLAPGTRLLAWSREDADFWCAGRDDVTATVVGSQPAWEAAREKTGTEPAQAIAALVLEAVGRR